MKRDLRFGLISMVFVALFSIFALGQETTGSIDITVKDKAGAVVPNVTITVASTGESVGFKRTVTTDGSGFARMIQIPPGVYSVTAGATAGFVEQKVDQIDVSLGKTTPVTVEMTTSVGATVDINATDVSAIDVTSTKIETTISAKTAELLPKGVNFSTILKLDPATRPEPRSGQFQIDGASGSENSFIVDGQEVTNVLNGVLNGNSNIPFSQIQEVQVKSSGFGAEYGGATGGVVNVVTKGGSDTFNGEFGLLLRSSRLEPIAEGTVSRALLNAEGLPYVYPSRKDQYNERNFTAHLTGPIIRKHLWFGADYSPQIFTQDRVLFCTYDPVTNPNCYPGRSDHYFFKQRAEKTHGRLDAQIFTKLHLTANYYWQPIIQHGPNPFPSFASEQTALAKQPVAVNPLTGAAFLNTTGGRQNSQSFSSQGVYVVTNNLIVTGRYGHYFLNTKLASYGYGDVTLDRVVCSTSGTNPPPGFGCNRGGNNGIVSSANTAYDATTRDIYEGDATYSFSLWGRHEVKGGYGRNAISNKVRLGTNDIITLKFGVAVGVYAQQNALPSTPGAIGSGDLQTFSTRGDVASKNDAIYIQDKWQPTSRLTLNLGVRTEKEDVPSFAPGSPGMKFNWSSKIGPRLGVAYALTSDNKTKVSAYYGLYYDRFKLNLPRGSFGGDEFHDLFFEIFPGDTLATINHSLVLGDGAPLPGGACPIQLAPLFGRVRCDKDNRIASNSGGALTEVGGIDPNIKPFQQRELTFTFQREQWQNTFSVRYTRKQVLHAIEDAGFPNSSGSEYYIIGNPGEGLYKEQADMFGTLAPKPQRDYDALEIRVNRTTSRWLYDVNYTYSRLYGNYGGLASSDEEGRSDPNTERYFDQPEAGFTVRGGPDNGRLPTDRPHVFKGSAAYRLDWDRLGLWKNNYTTVGLFGFVESGTPITSFADINGIFQIVLDRRGDQGRTPVVSQMDFELHHYINFGNEGRFRMAFDADILNLFNQHALINKGLNASESGNLINTTGYDVTNVAYGLISPEKRASCAGNRQCLLIAGYASFQQNGSQAIFNLASDPNSSTHNVFYNFPFQWQAKRQVRFGLRLLF